MSGSDKLLYLLWQDGVELISHCKQELQGVCRGGQLPKGWNRTLRTCQGLTYDRLLRLDGTQP